MSKEFNERTTTWRVEVKLIHLRLAAIHIEQAKLAEGDGLCAEYIALGRQALELDRELSAIFWELLGLKERSTLVPLSEQPLTPKIRE